MRKKGEGEASPSEELAHFTNRESEKQNFERLLNAKAEEPFPVVMFYGVGGTGKTWLRRKLWNIAREKDENFPCALVDFDPLGSNHHLINNPPQALAQLRYQLGCDCPRFDLAYAIWFHQTNGGSLPTSSPTDRESGLIEFLALLGRASPGAAAFAGASVHPLVGLGAGFAVWGGQKLLGYLARREKELKEDYKLLRTQTPEELEKSFIKRLGDDLDEHLPRRTQGDAKDGDPLQCRGIVFLDTYEAFDLKAIGDAQRPLLDAWVREFYEQTNSVLFVLCGQNRLKWGEWDDDWNDEQYLEQHLVGGLSTDDALSYLFKCRITDPALNDEILKTCLIVQGAEASQQPSYHPFSLGVCVDTLYNEKNKTGAWPSPSDFRLAAGDEAAIINRFLKSLDTRLCLWLSRLAVTRRFDKDAAQSAWEPAQPPGDEAALAWKQAQSWTFLQSQAAETWLLHSHMRDLILSRYDADELATTHQFWREHWENRSQNETDEHAELAWYHRYHLEPDAALRDWQTLAKSLRQQTRMQEHWQVVSWLAPLRTEPPIEDISRMLCFYANELQQSSLGNRAQNLHEAIACYDVALERYTPEKFPTIWAAMQNNKGIVLLNLPCGDRTQNLEAAIACFDASLEEDTPEKSPMHWAATQNNKGIALMNLPFGDRTKNLEAAIACYEKALEVRTREKFPMDWAMTQNNKGIALKNLPSGDRAQNLEAAIACFDAAAKECTLEKFPKVWAAVQNSKGSALMVLPSGKRTKNLEAALVCFEASLKVQTRGKFPMEWAMTHFKICLVLENAGNLIQALVEIELAIEGFHQVGHEHYLHMAIDTKQEIQGIIAAQEQPPTD